MSGSVRVVLPAHLRALAAVDGDVHLDVVGTPTQRSVLDALEARFPVLVGTIRDRGTGLRRPFVRFFACQRDLSHDSMDQLLNGQMEEKNGGYMANYTESMDQLLSMQMEVNVGTNTAFSIATEISQRPKMQMVPKNGT